MFEWTTEKIEFLKNNFYTMKRKELYNALGCTEYEYERKRQLLGLSKQRGTQKKCSEELRDYIWENYQKMTQKEIGDVFGICKSSIGRYMREMGLTGMGEDDENEYVEGDWQKFVDRVRKKYGLTKTTVAERR